MLIQLTGSVFGKARNRMIFITLYLFSIIVALGLALLAGWSDYKGMTIPNSIVLFAFLSFWICFGAAHFAGVDIFSSLKSHLAAGGLLLAGTFILFSMKIIGGGDSKLVAAYGFWMGFAGLPAFLFYTAFMGAVLGAAALFLKNKKPVKAPPEGSWIARVQSGDNVVPYGIPIAIGAFAGFINIGLLSPDNISLFLMPK